MAEAYTISMSMGDHAEEHSRRSYTPMSADKSLEDRNVVIYDCGDDKEHFNDFFRPAIEEYNARQKRADRKKSFDYYDELLNGREGYGKGKQQEKPIYDDVIQIGNRETNGVTKRTFDVDHWRGLKKDGKFHEASDYAKKHLNHDADREELKEILLEAAREIYNESANSREYRKANGLPPGKYDHILIHRMILHDDEPNGTPHIDMGYTIFTDEPSVRKDGKQNGLSTRVSMTKGLGSMGFRSTQNEFALEQFRNAIKDRIQEKMEERGYQRDIKGEHRRHLKQDMFEAEQRAKEAEAKKAEAEAQTEEILSQAEDAKQTIREAKDISDVLDTREAKIKEDEAEISRKKKKQVEKDTEQEAKAKELAKKETTVKKRNTDNANLLLSILRCMKPDRFDEETGQYKGKSKSMGELANEVQTEFQIWEDAFDAQKQAQEERSKALEKKAGDLATKEEGLSTKQAELDTRITQLEAVAAKMKDLDPVEGKAFVFETDRLPDGRVIPKHKKNTMGLYLKDESGRMIMEPAKELSQVVKEANELRRQLRSDIRDLRNRGRDGRSAEDDHTFGE